MKKYTESEILPIITAIYHVGTKSPRATKNDHSVIPEYYPGYKTMVDEYNKIDIHSTKGVFPEQLFSIRSPNQTDNEFKYIKENYKQITLPVFIDFVNSIRRAFNDTNWSIEYPAGKSAVYSAERGNTLQQYIENSTGDTGSIESWFKLMLPTLKIKDPNGSIAIRPKYIPIDESGEPDQSQLIEPVPVYYSIKQTVGFGVDYVVFESSEKSNVTVGTRVEKSGMIYHFYDGYSIFAIRQIGKKTESNFEVVLFWEHNIGIIPVSKLKGIPTIQQGAQFYQSPFLFATDNLDLVALNASNLQAVINKCVYPIRVMLGNECDFIDPKTNTQCENGFIIDPENPTTKTTCPKCNGSGLKTRLSPLGEIVLRPKSRYHDGDGGVIDPMKYVSPDTSTLDFLMKKIEDDETRARRILHLFTTNTEASGAKPDTATGKSIDEKALYSFIKPISDEMFEIMSFSIDMIGRMRYLGDHEKPIITAPNSFEFLSEQDYLNRISEAISNQLPTFVVHSIIFKFLSSMYYTEKDTLKVFELIMNADRLLVASENEISNKIARGLIEPWEEILHSSAIKFINELQIENPEFWGEKFTIEKRIELLVDKAKKRADEIMVKKDDEKLKIMKMNASIFDNPTQ